MFPAFTTNHCAGFLFNRGAGNIHVSISNSLTASIRDGIQFYELDLHFIKMLLLLH